MSYIDYINRFWQCEIERVIAPSDAKLYFYLLHTCNALRWKQPFGHSDRHLSLALGMSVNTVRESKNRLKQLGLIDFRSPDKGSKGIDGQTKIWFPSTVSNSDPVESGKPAATGKVTGSKNDTVADTIRSTVSKNDTVPDTVQVTGSKNDTAADPVDVTVSKSDTDADTVHPSTVSKFDRVSDTVPDTVPDTVAATVPATNNRLDKEKINSSAADAAGSSFSTTKTSSDSDSDKEEKAYKLTHQIRLTIEHLYPEYYWDVKDGTHAKKLGEKLRQSVKVRQNRPPTDAECIDGLKRLLSESQKLAPFYQFRDMPTFNERFNQIITQIKSSHSRTSPAASESKRSKLEIR
ncbi:hypothetical protein GCM10027299_09200 [Larkinella ripae]